MKHVSYSSTTVKPRFTTVFGGKETSAVNRGPRPAVNRGFVWFTLCTFSPIWGKGNGRGISGFAVNRGAVNRGFTVIIICEFKVILKVKYEDLNSWHKLA